MKIYDLTKSILEKYPSTRSDDKKLIWVVLGELGYIHNSVIAKEDFLNSPSFESIRRSRQKIQELHPELAPNDFVKKARKFIENQKGTHIFREEATTRNSLIDEIASM